MGKIWFQTSSGKRVYLPVVGNDINTPDTAIATSGVQSLINNRCLSGTFQVVVPTYGTITFDFTVPGRTGSCNQCGQCCGHPPANCTEGANCDYVIDSKSGWHVCQYLEVLGKGIGKSDGTRCTLRATILDNMKGCIFFPEKASEIESYMTSCGFSF